MTYRLSDIINALLKETKISSKLDIVRIEKAWFDTVGKIVSDNTKVKKISGNRLTVKASGPAWRNELTMQKPEIIKKLNKIQNKVIIKEITFI